MPFKEEYKKGIMRRVYMIWFAKKILSPAAVKIMLALAVLWRLKEYVSVRNVIANAPSLLDYKAEFAFYSQALFNTDLIVQALLAVGLALGILIVRDFLKGFSFVDGVVMRNWSKV